MIKFKKNISDTLKTKDREMCPMPVINVELIEALDERFPEQSADLSWTDRDIFYKSGQRSVVKFLIEVIKEQQQEN